MPDWLPYVLTFLGGSGFGYVGSLLVSPKSERDKMRLEERRLSIEEKKHVRERRIKHLERLQSELESAIWLYGHNNPNVMWPDFPRRAMAQMTGLTTALANSMTEAVSDDISDTLARAVRSFAAWTLRQVGVDEAGMTTAGVMTEEADACPDILFAAHRAVRSLLDSA